MLTIGHGTAISTGYGLLDSVVWLVILGTIAWLLWWFVNWIKLPQPFLTVAKVVIGLFIVIILAKFLLDLMPQ